MTYIPNNAVSTAVNTDPAGRTRVSQLTTLFDGKTINSDDLNIWENAGTGTITFTNNLAAMSVTAGQYAIRQSRMVNHYFSGKPTVVEATFDTFGTAVDVTKRVGYFSSTTVAPYNSTFDGFFIENVNGTISFKAYNAGTETMNTPLTSWTNYSEISLYDWDDFTVVMFDFLWLGGTEVRIFLKHPTKGFVHAHTEPWAGDGNMGTFIRSPNQFVRYDLVSSTGVGSMNAICSQVASEGSINSSGKSASVFNTTAITTNTVGTIYAIKSVRKVAGHRLCPIQVLSASITNSGTSDLGQFFVIVNPTLSAAISYTANSRFEEGTPTTQTITAGTGRIIACGPASNTGALNDLDDNVLSYIGMDLDATSDEIVLAYMPTTANQSVFGSITIKEY